MRRDRLVSGETTLTRMWVLSAVAVVLGLVGGGAAVGLFKLISLMTHLTLLGDVGFDLPTLRGYHPTPWLIPIAVGGGLLVSVFAAWAPVIRGHGIPESLEAILDRDSRIRPRAAIAKPLSAAITIGTGGPFGAEGPIIVTGGSVGSLIGQLLSVSPAERKIMLATGAAAGMSATFNTPIAAVILAIELVLFERSLRVVVPLSIASGIAAAIHVVAFGSEPLFMVTTSLHVSLAHLPLFALVGAASGLMAIVLNKGLFAMEAAFRRLPVNIFFWPAIGALGFALIGLLVPRTLSMGYSAIIDTLNGRFTVMALAVLLVAKLLSWLIALGSQTSGGTLAPMFLVGATMGCLLGDAVDALFPGWHVSPAAFALVAMGATFGAATKALFAAVVFAAEVTGEYTMIIPLLVGAGVAELVAEAFLSDRLMTEKLSHRGFRVEFRTAVDVLRTRVARQVMREPVWIRGDLTVAEARRSLIAHGLDRIAVVDSRGDYAGLVGVDDLHRAGDPSALAGRFAVTDVPPVRPDEYLSASMERFQAYAVDALPVVADHRVIGMLSRGDVEAERYRRGAAQELRQAGWLAGMRRPRSRGGSPARRLSRASRPFSGSATREKIVIRPDRELSLRHRSDPSGPQDTVRPAPQPAVATIQPSGTSGSVTHHQDSAGRTMKIPSTGTATVGHVAGRPAHGRLLPDPVRITPRLGRFVLSERSRIVLAWGSAEARPVAEALAAELRPATGFRLSVSDGRAYRDDIYLRLDMPEGLPSDQAAEGYRLEVGVSGVRLTAPTVRGLHHGCQTVRQLLPVWIASRHSVPGPWTMPSVQIVDYPRFGYRGLMLDLSRRPLSPAAVTRFVDRIAGYKMNALHLRLSVEQAAGLTATDMPDRPRVDAAARGPLHEREISGAHSGKGWTSQDYRDLVAHAAARFVTVVPEIAPSESGGSSRDLAVAHALMAMTPGPYYALPGGPGDGMANAPEARAMLDVETVAGWGKTAVRWSGFGSCPAEARRGELVEFCHTDAESRSLADAVAAAAAGGARFVMAPADHADLGGTAADSDGPTSGPAAGIAPYYAWDPASLVAGVGDEHITGVEAALWAAQDPTAPGAERAVFPRVLGAAEVAWSPRAIRTDPGPVYADFVARVAAQGPRLALTGTVFRPLDGVPWRLDLTAAPPRPRGRSLSGVIGMLVAPGFEESDLHVTVDWGDGQVTDGALVPGNPDDPATCWYSITAEHEYRHGGTYRAAITATGPGAVPARASEAVHVGPGARLRPTTRRTFGRRHLAALREATAARTAPTSEERSTVGSPTS